MKCPTCGATEGQVKSGFNESESQRRKCQLCGKRYTPEPVERGYHNEIRFQAGQMYVDGMNLRRIARHLGVSPQSVANWVNAHAAQLQVHNQKRSKPSRVRPTLWWEAMLNCVTI